MAKVDTRDEAVISIRISSKLLNIIDDIADSQGRSRSNMITRALKAYADGYRRPGGRNSYTLEKLYMTVLTLTQGAGKIHERLEDAAIGLSVLRPEHQDFPEELEPRFASIWNDLTWHDLEHEGEGTIRATLRYTEPEKARNIAERIFALYFDLLGISPLGLPRE